MAQHILAGRLLASGLLARIWRSNNRTVTDIHSAGKINEVHSAMTLQPDIHVKQPWERDYIAIAFANRLATGDSLSSIEECKCYDEDGADVTATLTDAPTISGSDVNIWIQAGENGKNYYLTVKANTTQGGKKEEDLIIAVTEEGHA